MDLLMLIIPILLILYILPIGYLAWIKPDDFVAIINGRRKKLKRNIFYEPWVGFLERNPRVEIYQARLASLFMLLVCVGMIFIAFHGPLTLLDFSRIP